MEQPDSAILSHDSANSIQRSINIPTELLCDYENKLPAVHDNMEQISVDEQNLEAVSDGVYLADLAAGEKMSMKSWRVEPGETLPTHSHHNEQIGYVISGTLTAIVEGEEYKLEPGDSYVFLSNEHHGAENRADEPAVGIGILSPPRGAPKWGYGSRESTKTPVETDD